jgi:hypothetical protein
VIEMMMRQAGSYRSAPGIELSHDVRFARRVRRLTAVSVVALGFIWLLWATTLETGPLVGVGLFGGWLLMPSILWLSLQRPVLRYLLVVPASFVTLSLLSICVSSLPPELSAQVGWMMVTAGILLGGTLGMWFWYRWAPVPSILSDPFSPLRWLLISVHVALISTGIATITLAELV